MEDNNEYKTCPDCCYDILDDEGDVMDHECISDNEMIAEFMGYVYEDDTPSVELPPYHMSWDWLMPVIQKCYKVENEEGFDSIVDAVSTLDIDGTYKAVVEFIKQTKTK